MTKTTWYDTEECREAMRLFSEGLSITETAKKFGKTKNQIEYAIKKHGVKSCISFHEGGRLSNDKRSRGELPTPRFVNADKSEEAERNLAIRLLQSGYNYLGGYAPKAQRPMITFSCQVCGSILTRRLATLHKGKLSCDVCRQREAENKAEQKRAEEERIKQERKRLREEKHKVLEEEKERRLNEIHSCKICGREYTIRDYVESTGMKYGRDSGFCSAECRKEQSRRTHKKYKCNGAHSHRARKFGTEYERGITLRKAVNRLGITCALCGKPCDWNDRSYGKYCGANYPSIDHIIPMSKGGGHTWKNIQIAHILCNSRKETTYLPQG